MNRWAVYLTTGAIDGIYTGPSTEADLQAVDGMSVTPIADDLDDTTAFVTDGTVQPKQPLTLAVDTAQITADGIDTATITGIPAGVSVTWPDGQTDLITDGEVRFSVDLPGTYTLRFTAVPYLDEDVTLEAIPAT